MHIFYKHDVEDFNHIKNATEFYDMVTVDVTPYYGEALVKSNLNKLFIQLDKDATNVCKHIKKGIDNFMLSDNVVYEPHARTMSTSSIIIKFGNSDKETVKQAKKLSRLVFNRSSIMFINNIKYNQVNKSGQGYILIKYYEVNKGLIQPLITKMNRHSFIDKFLAEN